MAEGRFPPDEPDDEGFPEDPASGLGEGGARGFLPDAVRKALLTGLGAFFLTEEGARRLAREWKLPKELIGYIGSQAVSAKDEILRVFADETRRFLESEPVRREFWKALSSMAIEIRAEVRLKPVEGGGPPRPEVKASVRPMPTARHRGKKAPAREPQGGK
jgi:hypothetical protein